MGQVVKALVVVCALLGFIIGFPGAIGVFIALFVVYAGFILFRMLWRL